MVHQKDRSIPGIEPATSDPQGVQATKKRKEHRPQGDDASTAEADPGRDGRYEQDEAHQANTTPNSGPHHELGCRRLKTWSESDFSIAESWPT